MDGFTTLDRANIYIGAIKGLSSIVTELHDKKEPTPEELRNAYYLTQDVSQALFWYGRLLSDAIAELEEQR